MLIAPSILAGDFSRLGEEAVRMAEGGAEWLHLDVMDGKFVPNITFGAQVVKALRPHAQTVYDVHLMIEEPVRFIKDFVAAGADMITVHAEACNDIGETLDAIHAGGCKAGLAVKPGTPAQAVYPYLDKVDMVLVMTVEPGFGGQSFMADMMPKVTAICEEAKRQGVAPLMQVDGGINRKTIATAAAAGANVFVAGSAVFGAAHPAEEIAALRQLAQG